VANKGFVETLIVVLDFRYAIYRGHPQRNQPHYNLGFLLGDLL
jgi:hypothetical protein